MLFFRHRSFSIAAVLAFGATSLGAGTARAQDDVPPPAPPPGLEPPPPPEHPREPAPETEPEPPPPEHHRSSEIVYLKADAGFSYIDMASFSSSTFAVQKTSSSGPVFGVGAGLRLAILTLGVKADLNQLSDFNMWQLDAELGLHIPSEHWDIYLGIHGGYAFVGTLDSTSVSQVAGQSPGAVSIYGGDGGLQLGADYYFNHFLSLGFEVAGSVLFLHRPPATLPADFSSLPAAAQQEVQAQPLYQNSGDSVGVGATGTIHIGVHL